MNDRRLAFLQEQVRWLHVRIGLGEPVSDCQLKAATDLLFDAEKLYMDAGYHLTPDGTLVRIEDAA